MKNSTNEAQTSVLETKIWLEHGNQKKETSWLEVVRKTVIEKSYQIF